MTLQPKDRYISPESEVLEFQTEGSTLVQTSYHYEPGWDD